MFHYIVICNLRVPPLLDLLRAAFSSFWEILAGLPFYRKGRNYYPSVSMKFSGSDF